MGGKTDRGLPKVDFKGFSLSVNSKHYSHEIEQKIINEIILPHIKSVRKELKLLFNSPALLVVDVF